MTALESNLFDQASPRVRIRAATAFFWLSAIFMLFWALGVRELWTAENRWAEITRNMLQSGDYFHPKINGEPYFDKPLIGYWVIALTAKVTGTLNEWSLRIPSALAGLVTLWMTIRLARQFWSDEAARITGWLLLSSYGFLFWARTGQADMANLAFTMAAIAWYWMRRDKINFVTFGVFYLICFVGAQMKGLGAIAIPCLAIGPDVLRSGRWKRLFTLAHIGALVLASVAYFAPFLIESATRGSYGESGLTLVFRENVQRFVDPFDHKEPFYIYFYHLPILFLPWTPLMMIALVTAIAKRRELSQVDYPTRYLLEASVLIFLFFTASGSRRSYYILPLVPFCALSCARFLMSTTWEKARRTAIDLQTFIVLVLVVGGLVVAASFPFVKHRLSMPLPPMFFVGLAVFGLLAILPSILRKRHAAILEILSGVKAELAVPLLGTAILMCGYFDFQHTSLDSLSTTRPFVRSLHPLDSAPKCLAFYQTHPTAIASVVYYLNDREPHPVLQTPDEVVHFLAERPDVNSLVITREGYQSLAAALPPTVITQEVAAEPTSRWESGAAKSRNWVVIRLSR